ADAAVLLVRYGETSVEAAEQSIAEIGADKFCGTLVVKPGSGATEAPSSARACAQEGRVVSPRLSVVIPTYNRASSVVRLLEQLAKQSVSPERFEVVVVDDGSAEDPTPRVSALRLPYACRVERQKNAGAA